jgi:secreted Zn-dependent insulinase-like peptidase
VAWPSQGGAVLLLTLLAGPQEWVYHELKAIADMKFRFLEEEDSCELVTRLASTMGWVEPQHLLVADYLHQQWQPEKVCGG